MQIRTTTRVLFGILVIVLVAAVLIWILQPFGAKGKDDKGGIPRPMPTVSTQETSTSSVQRTVIPTALKGRRYTNKVGGYSVIVPEGWKVLRPDRVISFLVRESQQREGEPPSFRLQIDVGNPSIVKENLGKMATLSEACIELRHSIQVAAFSGERWVCGDSEIRRMFVTVQRDDVFYWLGGAISVTDWERDFPIFEGILASIEFVPIEAQPPEQPSPVP